MNNNYIGLDRLSTENLFALCYAIDEFDQFDKELLQILSEKKSYKTHDKLIKLVKGKKCLFAKKEKEVYQNNEYIINIINAYGNLETFLLDNYSKEGENTYKGLKTFIEYLKKNKENIDNIIDVLEKIQELGFDKIIFDENFDFTKEIYSVCTDIKGNFYIEYLDNMEAIPNYSKQSVKYKTNGSNYKITLALISSKISLSSPFNTIALNSLTFPKERLPEAIIESVTFDEIISLSSTVEKEKKIIRDAIDLNTSIDDLTGVYKRIIKKIENIDSIANKEEIISLLNCIKDIIRTMEDVSEEHSKDVISKNTNITKQILEAEKKAYTKNKIHMKKRRLLWKRYTIN